jgi:hypothetical protein
MDDQCFLIRVRTEDKTATAAVGPIPASEGYQALVTASCDSDDQTEIVLVPAGVLDDILRAMNVLV